MTECIEFQNDFEGIVFNCLEMLIFTENIEFKSVLRI